PIGSLQVPSGLDERLGRSGAIRIGNQPRGVGPRRERHVLACRTALSLNDLPDHLVDVEAVRQRLTDPLVLERGDGLATRVPAHIRVSRSRKSDHADRLLTVELVPRCDVKVAERPKYDVKRAVLKCGAESRAIDVPERDLVHQGWALPITRVGSQHDLLTVPPASEEEWPAAHGRS